MKQLAVRWTIGDVSSRGYDALGLSILGLTRLLPDARVRGYGQFRSGG